MKFFGDVVAFLMFLRWIGLALALLLFIFYALYLIVYSLWIVGVLEDLAPKFLAKNDLIKELMDFLKAK